MRRWSLGIAALLVAAAPLGAATFKLCSQNTLHLGYSSSNTAKVTQLKNEFTGCDVTILQETMRRALDPPPPPAPPPAKMPPLPEGALRVVTPDPSPGNYTWNVPYTALLGKTSYKESYAFIVKSTLPIYSNPGFQVYFPTAPVAAKFARPPAAILLKTGAGTSNDWTWIVDLHAIFGKYVSDREAEARAMATFAAELKATDVGGQKYTRIVIGGDWNLDANNTAYDPLKTAGFTVAPNAKSSLTTTGAPSEPYDHFAFSTGIATGAEVFPMTKTEMEEWRKVVSDHMGIRCTVSY